VGLKEVLIRTRSNCFIDGLLDGPMSQIYRILGDSDKEYDRLNFMKDYMLFCDKSKAYNRIIYGAGEIISLIPAVGIMFIASFVEDIKNMQKRLKTSEEE